MGLKPSIFHRINSSLETPPPTCWSGIKVRGPSLSSSHHKMMDSTLENPWLKPPRGFNQGSSKDFRNKVVIIDFTFYIDFQKSRFCCSKGFSWDSRFLQYLQPHNCWPGLGSPAPPPWHVETDSSAHLKIWRKMAQDVVVTWAIGPLTGFQWQMKV